MMRLRIPFLTLVACGAMPLAFGQFRDGSQAVLLTLPTNSPRALVSQRVGLTDITIAYHRPLVNGRKLWGAVVPYGQVWRAGANENTTVEFSDPVLIEGQPLEKGVYGLHMLPKEDEWTVIFSKNSTSWGSFTYKQDEDALRVNIKPQACDLTEALTYSFDAPTSTSTLMTMRWEKMAVPVRIAVDEKAVTVGKIRAQLRGLGGYTWEAWAEGAQYLFENKMDLEEAARWAERSIQTERRFQNLLLKSDILAASNQPELAATTRTEAFDYATALELHMLARRLQAQKQKAQALEIFRLNAARHPKDWVIHNGLARAYSAEGKYPEAIAELKLAIANAPEPQKVFMAGFIKKLEAGQDFN